MIKFEIQAERNKDKDAFKVSVKGQAKGDGLAIRLEVAELLEKLDEIDGGEVLCDAFEIFIKRKLEGKSDD